MYETLTYERDDGIAVVQLNRPKKLNAINPQMVQDLRAVTDAIRGDESIRAVIFTGSGRAFSAGADIANLVEMATPPKFLNFIEQIQTTFNAIEDLNRPTIAALNGLAYGGGCELALSCDFRLMATHAALAVSEIHIGVLPGGGGTQRLAHMLPPAIAKQMIYFGDSLSSELALQHGLVNAVVPDGQVVDTAREWAQRLAKLPPLALRSAKMLVHAGLNADLKTGIEIERQAGAFLFGTEDRKIGMEAFLKKEVPQFTGK